MNIVVIADPMVPVPPANYGGTERIVDLMCRGLVQNGHRVHLMAAAGSRNYGGGLSVHRPPSLAYSSRAFRKLWFQVLALRAALRADVVINHGRIDYLEALYRTSVPVIHWFHNPLTGKEVSYIRSRRRAKDWFVGVSRSQVSASPDANQFDVVYNALDVDQVPVSTGPTIPPYVVFLGRMTRNKGVHLAISAAKRAGHRLVIGGVVPNIPQEQQYFESSIKPHLGPDCEWIGPYDEAKRIQLLSGATALLFPTQWSEPFAVVVLETLASGVPVIATRIASTPEAIDHGETGFLCESADEMAEAIKRVGQISRARCRQQAEQRFSAAVFSRNVERLIERAVTR